MTISFFAFSLLLLFLELEKCDPNPCYNNATCENAGIRFKCICPAATEPETAIVGYLCNESKVFIISHFYCSVNVYEIYSQLDYPKSEPLARM